MLDAQFSVLRRSLGGMLVLPTQIPRVLCLDRATRKTQERQQNRPKRESDGAR